MLKGEKMKAITFNSDGLFFKGICIPELDLVGFVRPCVWMCNPVHDKKNNWAIEEIQKKYSTNEFEIDSEKVKDLAKDIKDLSQEYKNFHKKLESLGLL